MSKKKTNRLRKKGAWVNYGLKTPPPDMIPIRRPWGIERASIIPHPPWIARRLRFKLIEEFTELMKMCTKELLRET